MKRPKQIYITTYSMNVIQIETNSLETHHLHHVLTPLLTMKKD